MEEQEQPQMMINDDRLFAIEAQAEFMKGLYNELNEEVQSLSKRLDTCNHRLHTIGNAVSGKVGMIELSRIVTQLVEDVLKARGLL